MTISTRVDINSMGMHRIIADCGDGVKSHAKEIIGVFAPYRSPAILKIDGHNFVAFSINKTIPSLFL